MAKTKSPPMPGLDIRKKRHEVYLKMAEILEKLVLPELKTKVTLNYSENLIYNIYVHLLGNGKRIETFKKMENEIKKAISQEDVPYDISFQNEIVISIKARRVLEINFHNFLGDNNSKDTKKDPGRPLTEFGLFQRDMIEFIESNSNVKHKNNPGFYLISDNSGEEKKTSIRCGVEEVTNQVLLALEKNPRYTNRIISVGEKEIIISENEQPKNALQSRSFVSMFISKLEKEAKEVIHSLKLKRETSVLKSIDGEDVLVKYLFEDENSAQVFVSRLDKTITTKKDGKVVRIETSIAGITKLLSKRILNPLVPIQESESQRRGLVTREIDLSRNPNPVSYVMSSADYGDFYFLKFNRERKKEHTMEIVESIKRHGVLAFVTVVITDCIDGVMRKWIVDGQHRFDAFKFLGLPVLYTVATAHSKKEMVRLIADLNKTSRKWATRNFLHAWNTLEIEDYTILKDSMEKTKLPITFLFEVFTGRDRKNATKLFQNGDFDIVNKEKSLKYIQYIMDIKSYLPRSREIYSTFVQFYRESEDYNHQIFMAGLKKGFVHEDFFAVGRPREATLRDIRNVYKKMKAA